MQSSDSIWEAISSTARLVARSAHVLGLTPVIIVTTRLHPSAHRAPAPLSF